MIDKLSPSAIRSYLSDRSTFYRKYVLKERDSLTGSSAVIGTVVHKYIEELLANSMLVDVATEFDRIASSVSVAYKKGEDRDKCITKASNAIYAFHTYPLDHNVDILGVEHWMKDTLIVGDTIMPLPLVCRADFIYRMNDGTVINVDYKTVSKFGGNLTAYKIQGWINMLLTEQEFGVQPAYMLYIELKTSKNKVKDAPLYNEVRIEYPTDEEQYVLCTLVDRIYRELNGENLIYTGEILPNPYDAINGSVSWEYFYNDVTTKLYASTNL